MLARGCLDLRARGGCEMVSAWRRGRGGAGPCAQVLMWSVMVVVVDDMVWDGTQACCGGWRLAVGVRYLLLLVRQARYCGLAMCAWIEETTLAACSAVPWVKASAATSVALALCKNHHLCRVTNVVTCRSLLHARRPASQLMARRDRWPPVAASGAAGEMLGRGSNGAQIGG
jgi:hypothetical protein